MEHLRYKTMQYNLARPEGYAEGERYPLLIYVHGAGGRGHDPAQIGLSYALADYAARRACPSRWWRLFANVIIGTCALPSWWISFDLPLLWTGWMLTASI